MLALAQQAGVARLDAQLLLAHVLHRPRSWLVAHDDAALEAPAHQRVAALMARRAAGEPLAYLTGEKEFHGLLLQVSPAVLIPRPDTETLVDWALDVLPPDQARDVLDLGTGSGAIALAIKHKCPAAQVTAVDVSSRALAVAAANAERLGLPVRLLQGDWWQAVDDERFDLVVSNPPYIAEGDAHLPALRHEPELALTPGGDGMGSLRHIISTASAHLRPGGWLLLEHGHDQSSGVRTLLLSHGFRDVATRADLAGIGRCTGGQWTG
ncbi:MAG: peptide chain release factor N(5)-glutamine methyltransferase [Rhizobacter sp.]|nr:peptide chain release factor N(5)-glutamine methyltransferase [Rhizobacter sp.]